MPHSKSQPTAWNAAKAVNCNAPTMRRVIGSSARVMAETRMYRGLVSLSTNTENVRMYAPQCNTNTDVSYQHRQGRVTRSWYSSRSTLISSSTRDIKNA
ncbi:hypothetical protein K439DRAFT_1638743 [Ramaria rubella]|nr:hypothetical protein K439DRAFT_1638743 [Ramaria rubella]